MAKPPRVSERNRHRIRPRNLAAQSLRSGLYRPRVAKNPNAYTRKGRRPIVKPEDTTGDD